MSNTTPNSSAVQSILDLKEALEALPSSSRLSSADADANRDCNLPQRKAT